ncbi:related to phospholipase C [Lecanosticta acicola]|uniref:Phosphoinositide phospholipase C n=1 Tax=Lecanosticta acicola TaxID=111012 RepID=A0AAI9EBU1_9PEZI|nr:related to phospholipase C [Lecanosticta acicola]
MSGLSSKFAKLNPFGKAENDEENHGEEVQPNSIAGGGHAARRTQITKEQLRVSHAIRNFLYNENVLSRADAGLEHDETTAALKEFLDKPHVHVPRQLTDRSHPLTEYFISSSHNTYLLAHQLYGTSSAVAYRTALKTGARCVEIDAWDNQEEHEEPKVTHGYTLASHIPFRTVCEAIRDVLDEEVAEPQLPSGHRAGPILLSLENHCGAPGQSRLVQIMRETWGDRLLSKAVRDHGTSEEQGSGDKVKLEELGSKIAVIVEYHLPSEADPESSADEDEDQQIRKDHRAYREEKKKAPADGIIPELADLGVYAQSVKPASNDWFESSLEHGPHNHLINVSESGLLSLLPAASEKIGHHNAEHLMRVYPKGTRISSQNLNPVPFWGLGAQICALNWQTFDHSMQLNEALFAGSDGYILKPEGLRHGGSGTGNIGRKRKLVLHIAGATDVPVPEDREADEIRPYVTCTLVHPQDLKPEPPKRKTSTYKHHKLGIAHHGESAPVTDPIWKEKLEWEYDDNALVFLRILIKSDDKFAWNPVFAVAAVRLLYVTSDWVFIRMLDLKGRETHCTLLVKFQITEV